MKALVTIPLKLSRNLMERCDRFSAEYRQLSSGIVSENALSFECDEEDAIHFAGWAQDCTPGARAQIEIISMGETV